MSIVGLDEKKLRDLRKSRGLRLSDVSEKTGIPVTLLSNYETGYNKPSVDNLLTLLDFYRVTNHEVTKKIPA